jgi:hypothetical protein
MRNFKTLAGPCQGRDGKILRHVFGPDRRQFMRIKGRSGTVGSRSDREFQVRRAGPSASLSEIPCNREKYMKHINGKVAPTRPRVPGSTG